MAKSSVISTADLINSEWEETIKNISDELNDLYNEALINNIDETFKKFVDSDNTTFSVGPRVWEFVRKNQFKEAFEECCMVTYKIQELAAFFRVKQYPLIMEAYNNSKSLVDMLYSKWCADPNILSICGSNVAVKSHADNAFLDINLQFNQIKITYERIRGYLAFIEEQMYGINRIDSMIRFQAEQVNIQFNNSAKFGMD